MSLPIFSLIDSPIITSYFECDLTCSDIKLGLTIMSQSRNIMISPLLCSTPAFLTGPALFNGLPGVKSSFLGQYKYLRLHGGVNDLTISSVLSLELSSTIIIS